MQFDLTDVKNEDDFGGSRITPGRYHATVENAEFKEFDTTKNVIEIEYRILAGTDPASVGKTIHDRLWDSEKALWRIRKLVTVLGLIKPGGKGTVNWPIDAPGCQLILEAREEQYEKDGAKKTSIKIGDFWSLGHKDVADVPRGDAADNGAADNAAADDDFSEF